MGEVLQITILGAVQGITEFVPISSSGHLVLARELFGMPDSGVAVDTVLHLGTLLAAAMYFYKDWIRIIKAWTFRILGKPGPDSKDFKEGLYIIIGTLPAIAIGAFFMDAFEGWFRDGQVVAGFMIVVGVWFLITEMVLTKTLKRNDSKPLNPIKALIIGVFQAAALIPGVSRSGMTISSGMHMGLSREKAARFSFLLSAPVILAAGILEIAELIREPVQGLGMFTIVVGFAVSAIVGFLAIAWLMKYLKKRTLYLFALYLIVVGGILLIAL